MWLLTTDTLLIFHPLTHTQTHTRARVQHWHIYAECKPIWKYVSNEAWLHPTNGKRANFGKY